MADSADHFAQIQFSQATGMIAAQIETNDMDLAAVRLLTLADEIGETVEETVKRVLTRQVRAT
jgi:hypothetical protein